MAIGNPLASVLLLILPVISILKKRVKRATIMVSSIEPLQRVNAQFRYKYRDWASMIRAFGLILLILSMMNIENSRGFINLAVIWLITLEIFFRNTIWRTLP